MRELRRVLITIIFFGGVSFIFFPCSSCNNNPVSHDSTSEIKTVTPVHVPQFNADTAYNICASQVRFGPRIPGTKAQQQCADYLENILRKYCDTVYVQKSSVKIYDGNSVPMINLIGSFNPKAQKRILLLAHWDTRPWSDRDATNPKKQFDGADDGASGPAILLACAEQFQKQKPGVGVDIFFCDVEDYGPPEFESGKWDEKDTYALGTQYWAKNPHVKNYRAYYGILLDMTAATNARFPKEGFSMQFAPSVVSQIWSTAQSIGFGNYFVNDLSNPITDDHYYVNTINGTPTIDIINLSSETKTGFAPHWHAQTDNMNLIDRETMKAVGQTLLQVIYNESAVN